MGHTFEVQGIHHDRCIAILERFLEPDCPGAMDAALAFMAVYPILCGRQHFSIIFSEKHLEYRLVCRWSRRRLDQLREMLESTVVLEEQGFNKTVHEQCGLWKWPLQWQ